MSSIRKSCFFTILFFASIILFAQKGKVQQPASSTLNLYARIDKTALEVPDSLSTSTMKMAGYFKSKFNKDTAIVRAIFIWIAFNIQYDVDNMFALKFDSKDDKITNTLKTRKGICENYAAIFTDLCQRCEIKSYVVIGYTKQSGFADYIPHAWCTAYLNSNWYLFDPTWGSGFVNNGKFYKRINNEYYKALPSRFIKSHIPFDPMWEFLNYPVSNGDFYQGKIQPDKTKPYFNYEDSIKTYTKQNDYEQWVTAYRRTEANGVKNSLIYERLKNLKENIQIYDQNQKVNEQNDQSNKYNASSKEFNEAVNYFNEYIRYKNVQFAPTKPDPEIREMIDLAKNKVDSAKVHVLAIKNPNESLRDLMISFVKSINTLSDQIKQEEDFVSTYLSRNKFGRKNMFYKRIY